MIPRQPDALAWRMAESLFPELGWPELVPKAEAIQGYLEDLEKVHREELDEALDSNCDG